MASADTAIQFVLRQEDARLAGVVTTDRGGRTRFGIAERFHPELTGTGYFDTMDHDAALAVATSCYKQNYWTAIRGDEINSQHICNALLSFAVVEGPRKAVAVLQRALGSVFADGLLGPSTLKYINAITDTHGAAALMSSWQQCEDAYFGKVVEAHPEEKRNLQGWLNRVKAATE